MADDVSAFPLLFLEFIRQSEMFTSFLKRNGFLKLKKTQKCNGFWKVEKIAKYNGYLNFKKISENLTVLIVRLVSVSKSSRSL